MTNLVLFDFDGTLLGGDSTKLAYKILYKNEVTFYLVYYVKFFKGFIVYFLTGNYSYLKELRRTHLERRFEILKSSSFTKTARKNLFKIVYKELEGNIQKGNKVVIISAGYSELIRLIMGDEFEYELIANSLFDKKSEAINYENKVTRLNLEYKSNYQVKAAYGNTKGDIPMLELAEKAFWVDKNGRIAEFSN